MSSQNEELSDCVICFSAVYKICYSLTSIFGTLKCVFVLYVVFTWTISSLVTVNNKYLFLSVLYGDLTQWPSARLIEECFVQ